MPFKVKLKDGGLLFCISSFIRKKSHPCLLHTYMLYIKSNCHPYDLPPLQELIGSVISYWIIYVTINERPTLIVFSNHAVNLSALDSWNTHVSAASWGLLLLPTVKTVHLSRVSLVCNMTTEGFQQLGCN